MSGNDSTSFLECGGQAPRRCKLVANNLCRVLGSRVNHHEHLFFSALSVETSKAGCAGIHALNRRVDLQNAGALCGTSLQFVDRVSSCRVDGYTRTEQFGKVIRHLKKVLVGNIKRSVLHVRLSCTVVSAILG